MAVLSEENVRKLECANSHVSVKLESHGYLNNNNHRRIRNSASPCPLTVKNLKRLRNEYDTESDALPSSDIASDDHDKQASFSIIIPSTIIPPTTHEKFYIDHYLYSRAAPNAGVANNRAGRNAISKRAYSQTTSKRMSRARRRRTLEARAAPTRTNSSMTPRSIPMDFYHRLITAASFSDNARYHSSCPTISGGCTRIRGCPGAILCPRGIIGEFFFSSFSFYF